MASNLNSYNEGVVSFITYYETPNKLTFDINRNVQLNTILRDGKLMNQLDQPTNAVNIIEQDGEIIGTVDHEGQVLCHYRGDTVAPMISNFIKCSDTTKNGCFGGDGKFDEPLEPNTDTKKRVLARRDTIFPRFVVVMDRKWTDIALYQVCRWFRQYAIKRFGIPKKYKSFPFDPVNDTLYLLGVSNHRIGQLLRTGREAKPPVFDFELAVFQPWADSIDLEPWDRIRTVETDTRIPWLPRSFLLGVDYRIFCNIHTWRILTIQFDTCKTTFNPDAETLFRCSDLSTFCSVFYCLSGGGGFYPTPWDPKVIEIFRKGCVCSNTEELTWKNTRTPSGGSSNGFIAIDNTDIIVGLHE
ncbi:hypothetical protein VMCG_05925 [Cytospora schulzeri]|uniref:Uncharacterized protein n=1 Tax=Cytospora schulzeri TaxID=448051 RepID=A0A423WDH7_9PEZI|nr:hypothetical protein VMCG_05925 [Valsa malicola]